MYFLFLQQSFNITGAAESVEREKKKKTANLG